MARNTRKAEAYNETLPERLRILLDESGSSQKALAEALETTPQNISLYATGGSKPDWKTIAQIATHFQVSADWLLGLSDDRHRTPSAVDSLGLSERAVAVLSAFHACDAFDFCNVVSFLIEQEGLEQYHLLAYLKDEPCAAHNLNRSAILSMIGAYLKDPHAAGGKRCFIDEEGRVTVEAPEQDAGAHHFDLVSFPLSDLVGQVLLSGIADQLKALRADYKEYQKKGAGGNGNSPKD